MNGSSTETESTDLGYRGMYAGACAIAAIGVLVAGVHDGLLTAAGISLLALLVAASSLQFRTLFLAPRGSILVLGTVLQSAIVATALYVFFASSTPVGRLAAATAWGLPLSFYGVVLMTSFAGRGRSRQSSVL